MSRPQRMRRHLCLGIAALLATLLAACGGSGSSGQGGGLTSGPPGGTIRLYTSYNQPEVDAVIAAYARAVPAVHVDVFRAPSGQLAARIAAEQRGGGVRGDVLLLSDPLTMGQYDQQGLLWPWSPAEESAVSPQDRTDTFFGVTASDVVVVSRRGSEPRRWKDLTHIRYKNAVAIPDPNFAGSAFAALGYFAFAKGFGMDFYRNLKANGAVQVQAPGDVITGVAQGRFQAGMTLDFLARAAIAKGSPIVITAPLPGAIRLYAPVAVFAGSGNVASAESFAGFLLTAPAQQALAALDRRPIRADVPAKAPALPEVRPDWTQIIAGQAQLRTEYRAIFGG